MENAPIDTEAWSRLPPGLRELVRAELADGNRIVEIGGPPAPPVGLAVRLARPMADSRRKNGPDYTFYERRGSLWSGEFTDPRRHFFVLEPPGPPEPEPDMDAIRARMNQAATPPESIVPRTGTGSDLLERKASEGPDSGAVARFVASRRIDYAKWKEGEGYDLQAIAEANPAERQVIETLLVHAPARDWRDVEALAALGTPGTEVALRRALESDLVTVRLAVLRFAPHLISEPRRTRVLAEALASVVIFGGLTEALSLVAEHHPPEVLEALWRGVLEREGEVATHFAGMLLFLGGQSSSSFDWNQRPFLLRFNTPDPAARAAARRELAERLGQAWR